MDAITITIGVNPDQFRKLSFKARLEAVNAEFEQAKESFVARLVKEGLLSPTQLQLDFSSYI